MKFRILIAGLALAGFVFALLAYRGALGAATPAAAGGTSWPSYGGNVLGEHYSALDGINTSNVAKLKGAWTFQTHIDNQFTSFEGSPIVVGDTLYLTDPYSGVYAFDAANGQERWSYHVHYKDRGRLPICCADSNRGVAVGEGNVYVAQLNAKLTALNERTGDVRWSVAVGDPKAGYSETEAPLYYGGKVYVGVAGGEFEIRGYVSAYDARTGKLLWRFYTIPAPGQPGHNTWGSGSDWQHGGGGVWQSPVIDPQLGTLYFVVGNPSPDLDGHIRPGNNLYSDSIVALDASTGKMRWYFQEVHHDLWDDDPASPPLLYDTSVNGKQALALA